MDSTCRGGGAFTTKVKSKAIPLGVAFDFIDLFRYPPNAQQYSFWDHCVRTAGPKGVLLRIVFYPIAWNRFE